MENNVILVKENVILMLKHLNVKYVTLKTNQ